LDSAEKNLIELSAKGNVEAFETLVQAHQKRVYNIALRMTKNVCTDFLRKRNKAVVVSLEQGAAGNENYNPVQLPEKSPGPDELAEKKQLKEMVKQAMDLLSVEHRQVLILRDLMDLTYKDIANTLNVNEGTIKSRINRARDALKHIIIEREELFKDYVVKLNRREGNS
jgi:RNA polymerase sigma-70 factor (ECF subfamily)